MKRLNRIAALALAGTMVFPGAAWATSTTVNSASSGNFDTSFSVYSPELTISVPLTLSIQVNPLANTSDPGVRQFTVASNSIDIINASVDVEEDAGIPVDVTVKGTITNQADGVQTTYNSFTNDPTSAVRKAFLQLSQAQTAAGTTLKMESGTAVTPTFDSGNKLDLSKYETETTAAVYTTPKQSVTITKYGSLLSMGITGPTTTDNTAGKKFSTDATKITPAVGSFAVTGVANAGADWKESDIAVSVTYAVKASEARNVTTPTITSAPTFTAGSNAADITITVPGVGEAKVKGIACHNDGVDLYGDYVLKEGEWSVVYDTNSSTNKIDATITIPKDAAFLGTLGGADYSTKAQDMVIALDDGRSVVTTLTVTGSN